MAILQTVFLTFEEIMKVPHVFNVRISEKKDSLIAEIVFPDRTNCKGIYAESLTGLLIDTYDDYLEMYVKNYQPKEARSEL